MEQLKSSRELKMKKENQIMKMLLVVINIIFLQCSSEQVDVLNIQLSGLGKNTKSGDTLFVRYRYFPTDQHNIFYAERMINQGIAKDTGRYFLNPKTDTTFIGKSINDTVYFVPYLFKSKNTKFNFNAFLKNAMFLDASRGTLRWIGSDSQNINYYKGFDFGISTEDSIKIGFSNGYVTTSLSIGNYHLTKDKIYKTRGRKVFIENVKYIPGFSK